MIESILANFQKECRDDVIKSINNSQKKLIIKSPTGSGKTVIMSSVIEKFLAENEKNHVFIWLCPGSGELEEQSKKNFESKCPRLSSKDLSEVLTSGFEEQDTVFINWELVIKKGNRAISDSERKNIFERIADAHRSNLNFIIIIDEEQSNDTQKAQDIINAFSAVKEIRMSATAKARPGYDFLEIKESDVIKEQFISKAIVINEGLKDHSITEDNEYEVLISMAIEKQKNILEEYKKLNKKINPLIIIQFPSASESLITYVEEFLRTKNISYENGLLAKWMSDEKDKINLGTDEKNITEMNAFPIVLLMKQAISTGWDCPRAKILVKLRENMNDDFEIQTIGRIRRMPERKHYDNELLDYCFLYTLDTKYVESVKQSTDSIYEIKKVFLKDEFTNIHLTKEMKNQDGSIVDIKKVKESIYSYFKNNYSIDNNLINNKEILSNNEYHITNKIINYAKYGIFNTLSEIKSDEEINDLSIEFDVNTHKYGYALMNAVNHIAQACLIDTNNMSVILRKLFREDSMFSRNEHKILKLNKKDYYAFIINNDEKLRRDFREATMQLSNQLTMHLNPVEKDFIIPEVEHIKFDSFARDNDSLNKNVYEGYTEQTLVKGLRSKPERMFEEYCENEEKIKWVYKNGDSGIEYFSIVYTNSFGTQMLFYPDYILVLESGEIWIIEAKGEDNIDKKTENKFESLKQYAKKHGLKWAFVRDYEEKLYYNNTEYVDSMLDKEKWKPLKECF